MAKKRSAPTGDAGAEATPLSPPEAPEPPPPSDTNGNAREEAAAEPQKGPLHVLSYQVGRDTFIQAAIWGREASGPDGVTFLAYDVSLRKRYKDVKSGEWKSVHSFRSAELFAATHALEKAEAWILDTRAADCPF
jgi:hypothetical protein